MGKLYILLGKSASGKDSAAERVLEELQGKLFPIIPYTTRPMREGEAEGDPYHFVTEQEMNRLESEGKIIERRTYQTVNGPWNYFTVDDGNIDLAHHSYLSIATLEALKGIRSYYPEDWVVPILINVDDGERLLRAVRREQLEDRPNYREVCRRFLADEEDYSAAHLKEAGIRYEVENDSLKNTVQQILSIIRSEEIRQQDGSSSIDMQTGETSQQHESSWANAQTEEVMRQGAVTEPEKHEPEGTEADKA